VVLSGSADFNIQGDLVHVAPDTAVRVAPATKRSIKAGSNGVRILALGAIPGKAYSAPAFTELGGPEQPGS